MRPLRQQTAIIAVGTASILLGVILLIEDLPSGRALVVAGVVALALTLGNRR